MSKAATVACVLCHCFDVYFLSRLETMVNWGCFKCWQYKVCKQKKTRQVNSVAKISDCAWNCQWKFPFVNHNHFKRAGVLCETIISCFVHSLWSTHESSYSFITVVKELYSMDVDSPSPKLMARSKEKGVFNFFFSVALEHFPRIGSS